MLRHPAAVIDSKQRWYGGWQGEVGRAAGWVNQTLFTERATRDVAARVRPLRRPARGLDARGRARRRGARPRASSATRRPPRCATCTASSTAGSAARARTGTDISGCPAPLRAQADEVWRLVGEVAAAARRCDGAARRRPRRVRRPLRRGRGDRAVVDRRGRRAPAVRAPAARAGAGRCCVVRRVPLRWRRRVPLRWRRRVVRVLASR